MITNSSLKIVKSRKRKDRTTITTKIEVYNQAKALTNPAALAYNTGGKI